MAAWNTPRWKVYQLLISSHLCSVGERGIGWKLHQTVDAYSGLWGPQMTWLCWVQYEALLLRRRRVNRTTVESSGFTTWYFRWYILDLVLGIKVTTTPRYSGRILKCLPSHLLEQLSLLDTVMRIIIATVGWAPATWKALLEEIKCVSHSFSLQPCEQMSLFPFNKWGNQGSNRLSNLP